MCIARDNHDQVAAQILHDPQLDLNGSPSLKWFGLEFAAWTLDPFFDKC
jgi:hypothetical protein